MAGNVKLASASGGAVVCPFTFAATSASHTPAAALRSRTPGKATITTAAVRRRAAPIRGQVGVWGDNNHDHSGPGDGHNHKGSP